MRPLKICRHYAHHVKAIIFAALGTCMVFAASASAQQSQPHPLEAEYKSLASIHRALSSCPSLIEEWELQEIRSRLVDVEIALERMIKNDLPVAFERDAITEAGGADCTNPQVQTLASQTRRVSQLMWKARYAVIENSGACNEILAQRPDRLPNIQTFDRRVSALLGNSDETRAQLQQESARLEAPIIQSCEYSVNEAIDGVPRYNSAVHSVTDPVDGAQRRAGQNGVERNFDLNKGWTLGYGDTAKAGETRRNTAVFASRTYGSERKDEIVGNVIIGKAACGDFEAGTRMSEVPRLCSLIIRRDGGIGLVTYVFDTPMEYRGDAVLRIFNPQDGAVVITLQPVKRDGVHLVGDQDNDPPAEYAANGVTYFENVIEQLKPLHPLMQMQVSLLNENGDALSAIENPKGQTYPQTVAVGDVRQAYAFAYASKADDLTVNGVTQSFYEAHLETLVQQEN